MKTRWQTLQQAILGLLICFVGAGAQAQVTNFSTDVGQAIDDGLDWLDSQGAFNNPSFAGDASGLTLLALLDKRESADIGADAQGYANASVADQARMRTSVEYILDDIQTQNFFYAYRDGAYLMALSRYLRSGGPEIGGTLPTLVDAINIVFDRIAPNQTAQGYWCYFGPNCPDSSTTQLVMAGLAAAKGVYSDPLYADAARLATLDTLTANARAGYIANGTPGQVFAAGGILDANERGHGYNAGNTNSIQQTASGVWIQLVGGADLNDPSVQGYLLWIYNRYGYSDIGDGVDGFWGLSYFYYLWSSSKAYNFLNSSGVAPDAGNLSPSSLGTLPPGDAPAFAPREEHRDPTTDVQVPRFGAGGAGYYSAETPDWYYDYAYTLLSLQDAAGAFQPPAVESFWDYYARQAYAILVLQRSVGGGCIDTDGDGICDEDDNCPLTENPDQADADGDGVGDVCDNCPETANPGQEDSDDDGIGDACEGCVDTDGDGVCDVDDNCPATPNPNQEDADGDGVGDVCDNCPETANPGQEDSDDDGIGDACEVAGQVCDVEPDGDVDRLDIRAILRARNNPATGPDDPMDANGDGQITSRDAKICTQQCTLPRCASPAP